jgi:hypothetical protein
MYNILLDWFRGNQWIGSQLKSLNYVDDSDGQLTSIRGSLKQRIIDQDAQNGSMWVLQKVLKIDLHIGRHKSIREGSYIPLPEALALKKKR